MFELATPARRPATTPSSRPTPRWRGRGHGDLLALCDDIAADRRANPRDDLMTALVQAELDGDRLDELELNLFFVSWWWPATRPPATSSATRTLALLDHPDAGTQLARVDDPALWDTGGRGDAALGHARSTTSAAPPPATPRSGACPSRPATRSSSTTRRPTATRTCSPTRTRFDIAPHPERPRRPSAAAACTSAWAPAWPGSRSRPSCARCVRPLCPTSTLAGPAAACAPTSSTASSEMPVTLHPHRPAAAGLNPTPLEEAPTMHTDLCRPARHRVPHLRLHPLP